MKLSNMKVGTMLGTGFALVLGLLCVILVGALYGMADMRGSTRQITDNNLRVELANVLIDTIRNRAIQVRNIGLLADPAAMTVQQRAMNDEAATYAKTWKELAPLLDQPGALPEEKAALAEVAAAEAAAMPVLAKATQLGLANQKEESTRVLTTELQPLQDQWIAATNALIVLEGKLNKEAGAASLLAYERARNMSVGLSCLALVAGVLAAVGITRTLLRQLGGEPRYAAEVAARIAAGDLASPVEVKAGDSTSMMAAMQAMRDKLACIVAQVRGGTDAIASASAQVAAGSLDLSSRTEEQASSLEETASSMEELTGTVKQNADNARQANLMADAASSVAQKGGAAIGEVMGTMADISASASKIRDIIGVIDGIAFQTNILALNAAVEAARAGEQGRGFAVVATEVRNLAQRSAGAAKEIKGLIEDSTSKVENGSRQVDAASATILEVVDSVKRVTDIMSEISAASLEQTVGIEQINQAIVSMDQVTQQNAALVEEAAAASEAMQVQAARLSDAVSVFRLDCAQTAPPPAAPHAARPAPKALSATKPAKPRHAATTAPQRQAMATAANGWETF
ncbi:methyl-accepting chemotaxis protein [Massilia sp. DD77]|uniref:methyl-accepting chemotaxis protein n=1 Tax=Massilia sp. DD77 TaxID=3109349 RepID=UPI002FFF1933